MKYRIKIVPHKYQPAMFKIALKLKLCFGLCIISILLCFFYISSFKEYVQISIFNTNSQVSNIHNEFDQDDYSVLKAIEHLKGTVGSIPDFTPTKNGICPIFPDIFNLHINNDNWQVLETTNGTFYLFGAYYDDREKNSYGPSVRIIGMVNRLDPTVQTICQFWYKNNTPIEVPVSQYQLIWYRPWGVYTTPNMLYPYLITCDVPDDNQNYTPGAVSLVELPCAIATNNLVVNNYYEPPEVKKDFVVCVKGLDFPFDDLTVRLIEWIELLKLFGVDKIVFYNLDSHPNIDKLLDYYTTNDNSFVEVKPITLPSRQLNFGFYQHFYLHKQVIQKRFAELVAYNDCFYQNMYNYKYVVLLDIDEIIVPTQNKTWKDLIQRIHLDIGNITYSSFSIRNVYFLDTIQNNHKKYQGIPKELHMLQHITRTKNFTRINYFIKSFHNTEEVLTLHNHLPLECFTKESNRTCNYYSVNTSLAQLNHYREDCGRISELGKLCQKMKNDSVIDETLWRFTDELVARVRYVAKELGVTLS